jgi:hypothetical protein
MLPESVAMGRRSADMIDLSLTHRHNPSNTNVVSLNSHPQPTRELHPFLICKLLIS